VQGGAIKLYKGLACPLCNYELLLFSLAGPDGKTFPLCPYCYNTPLEGAAGKVPNSPSPFIFFDRQQETTASVCRTPIPLCYSRQSSKQTPSSSWKDVTLRTCFISGKEFGCVKALPSPQNSFRHCSVWSCRLYYYATGWSNQKTCSFLYLHLLLE
jgi:hypothetical protein